MQFRAFPGLVGLRILSFESVDYFGTNEQFSGRKKKNLNQRNFDSEAKLSLYVNESCDEHALYFRR